MTATRTTTPTLITITIDCSSPAFRDDANATVARLLRELAAAYEDGSNDVNSPKLGYLFGGDGSGRCGMVAHAILDRDE